MAGLGRKVFTAGDVLTASDVQNYMMDQSVMYFAGTAARSSAIATPTTGMTSYIGTTGTASIPQIETYTGSQWQTPYGATLVANVSFSAASSISINNVFNSTYDNYMVVHNITASSATVIRNRLRVSGTDNSSSNYLRGGMYVGLFANSVFSSTNNTTEAFFTLGSTSATVGFGGVLNFIAPFQTQYTKITSHSGGADLGVGMCVFNGTTSFDGFSLYPDAGTLTGTIRVYGLRNS